MGVKLIPDTVLNRGGGYEGRAEREVSLASMLAGWRHFLNPWHRVHRKNVTLRASWRSISQYSQYWRKQILPIFDGQI